MCGGEDPSNRSSPPTAAPPVPAASEMDADEMDRPLLTTTSGVRGGGKQHKEGGRVEGRGAEGGKTCVLGASARAQVSSSTNRGAGCPRAMTVSTIRLIVCVCVCVFAWKGCARVFVCACVEGVW